MRRLEPIDVTIARWYLDELRSDATSRLGCDMLEAGYDSPSLRLLAGMSDAIAAEVGPLLDKTLREFGLRPPTSVEAMVVVTRFYAQQILTTAGDPLEPAEALVARGFRGEWYDDLVLPFLGLTSLIVDYEFMAQTAPDPYRGYAAACRADLREAADQFLAETAGKPGFSIGPPRTAGA